MGPVPSGRGCSLGQAAMDAARDRTPPEPEGPFDRYMALVIAVNNAPPDRFPFEWLAAALRASALPAP